MQLKNSICTETQGNTSLSQAQSRAVAHGIGPAMVLAGPGSGKTLVITNRTKYLIEQYGIKPEEILVITFTKAAAMQMRERFDALMGGKRARVTFGTFHAVFFQILKYAYHFTSANILTEEKKYQFLGEIAGRMKLDIEDEKEFLSDVAAEISLVKNEQISLEHYYSSSCGEDIFRTFFRSYQKQLENARLLDFDDMLVYCYDLFCQRPDILAQWQRRFQYILVDEFQDINQLQYHIVQMLAKPGDNLFVVGDDDQSIYRFRGAKPEIMLNFPKDYPEAQMIVLDENYRSTKPILDAASQVIRENKNRFPKNIRCMASCFDIMRQSTAPVDIRECKDQEQEAILVIQRIKQAVKEGALYSDLAVLTRTNVGGRYMAEKLMEFNLPVCIRDAMPNLYDHWISQDVFAYIRLAMGIRERKDFLQIMNRPKRYISRECVDTPQVDFERLRTWYDDKPWMVKRIDQLEDNLRLLQGMRPYAAVNYIRHGLEYEAYLKEYAEYRHIRLPELLEIMDELQESSKNFKSYREWFEHMEEYRQILLEQNQKRKEPEDAVTLSTLHSSKGLEFQEVFLLDVNEEIIPHKKASLEADIEEERRLLYVGMTRARKRLHLFYLKERYGKYMEPSSFIENLLPE